MQSSEDEVISRHVHHDLESFIWVIFYAIYKHTVLDTTLDSTLRDEVAQDFKYHFGGGTLYEILTHRTVAQYNQSRLRACHPGEGILNFLLSKCSYMLFHQNPPPSLRNAIPKVFADLIASAGHEVYVPLVPTPITYNALEKMLRVALKVLSSRALN